GEAVGDAETVSVGTRLVALVTDYWPVLLGYDTGYPPVLDWIVFAVACAAGLLAVVAIVLAPRKAPASPPHAVLVVFLVVDVMMAVLALQYVPHNPRYLLFLMAPLPIFLAELLGEGRRRLVFVGLVAFGALASLAHLPGTVTSDERWRDLVAGLEREGVRYCYTDFHLATRINFLSAEKGVSTAQLGATTTEYFFAYRETVERAPEAALIPVNQYAAERLGQRLTELGVSYERRDFLKPVLLRLSRKVDPQELFPHRSFPMR